MEEKYPKDLPWQELKTKFHVDEGIKVIKEDQAKKETRSGPKLSSNHLHQSSDDTEIKHKNDHEMKIKKPENDEAKKTGSGSSTATMTTQFHQSSDDDDDDDDDQIRRKQKNNEMKIKKPEKEVEDEDEDRNPPLPLPHKQVPQPDDFSNVWSLINLLLIMMGKRNDELKKNMHMVCIYPN